MVINLKRFIGLVLQYFVTVLSVTCIDKVVKLRNSEHPKQSEIKNDGATDAQDHLLDI